MSFANCNWNTYWAGPPCWPSTRRRALTLSLCTNSRMLLTRRYAVEESRPVVGSSRRYSLFGPTKTSPAMPCKQSSADCSETWPDNAALHKHS